MAQVEVIISGFGGQGALFAGQLLAYAGIAENLRVTWIPSYGPEMRGGTANCTVILSDEEIGAPIIRHPDVAVVLNLPSMEKYERAVKSGGLLIVNESLVSLRSDREDLRVVYVPASETATELGNPRMANLVLLGALIRATGIVTVETVVSELGQHISERHRKWLEPNKVALRKGAEMAAVQLA